MLDILGKEKQHSFVGALHIIGQALISQQTTN